MKYANSNGRINININIAVYNMVRIYLVRFTIFSNVKKINTDANVYQKLRILIRIAYREGFIVL